MSRLDVLIQELCPEGVEYKNVGDLANISRGRVMSKDYIAENAGEYPVYSSQTENDGELGKISTYDFEGEYLTWTTDGANAGYVFYRNGKFSVTNVCGLIDCNNDEILTRYMYHYLSKNSKSYVSSGMGNPKLMSNVMARIKVAVPPLEVQREIVRILDSFTLLTAKLTAELTARKSQYKFYRTKLIEQPINKCELVPVSDLGKWTGGKTPSMANMSFWENGTIPWISSKDMKSPILENTEDHITETALSDSGIILFPENITVIVIRSGILKHTFPIAYVPFRTTVNQDIKALVVRDGVDAKYAFHVIQAYAEDIRTKTKKQGGTVDSLEFSQIMAYKVPLPTLDIQRKLVHILDNFQAICSDLNIGLPAEIEARQKQYEYYRDALLTYASTGKIIAQTDRQTDRQTSIIKLIQFVYGFVNITLDFIAENCDSLRKPVTSGNREAGEYPYYGASGIVDYVSDYIFDGDYLLVSEDGANLLARSTPIAFSISGKNWVNNHAHVLRFETYATRRYVEFYLNSIDLSPWISGGTQPKLNQKNLNKINIPLPPLEEQKRIVGILDRFDTLCNDLSSGLPAEIEARQKQYEYYRDRLLNFEPIT